MDERTFSNVSPEAFALFSDFWHQLRYKTIGYANARHLPEALLSLYDHPKTPERNFVVSFQYEDTYFYIIYTDYKIELRDSFCDDGESYTRFCFRYELDGYVEEEGNLREFRELLFNSLRNVKVTQISISEEE